MREGGSSCAAVELAAWGLGGGGGSWDRDGGSRCSSDAAQQLAGCSQGSPLQTSSPAAAAAICRLEVLLHMEQSQVQGLPLRLYWEMDDTWYPGTVTGFDEASAKHQVGGRAGCWLAGPAGWERGTGSLSLVRGKGSLPLPAVGGVPRCSLPDHLPRAMGRSGFSQCQSRLMGPPHHPLPARRSPTRTMIGSGCTWGSSACASSSRRAATPARRARRRWSGWRTCMRLRLPGRRQRWVWGSAVPPPFPLCAGVQLPGRVQEAPPKCAVEHPGPGLGRLRGA